MNEEASAEIITNYIKTKKSIINLNKPTSEYQPPSYQINEDDKNVADTSEDPKG